jgi:hypothetical protein
LQRFNGSGVHMSDQKFEVGDTVLRNAAYEPDEFREMFDGDDLERRTKMFVRLKLEDTREGLVATISQRGDDGKITGRPSIFLVGGKEEAKQRAKAVARALGLKTYGVVDKTSSRTPSPALPAVRNLI